MDASLRELEHIAAFLEEVEDDRTVLIGGWAVQAYNPWYGSIDIDFVMRGSVRNDLFYHLRKRRGYLKADVAEFGYGGVYLKTGSGPIIIDVFTRERDQPFEGRKDKLNFSVLDEGANTTTARIGSVTMRLPTRSLLLLFKLKAAWDRSTRIAEGRSPDAERESGKVDKDHQDVLALLDPARGGRDIDLEFMADAYEQYPFLVATTRRAYENPAGPRGYGIDERTAREWIELMLGLLGR